MKLGIIGLGIVGTAISKGFKVLQHEIVEHDIKFNTKIQIVLDCEIVFIAVPSPTVNGVCDTSIIEDIIKELSTNNYKGIIAIKSTVYPGFTDNVSKKYSNCNICFVPEFLRERCAIDDFINNHQLLVVGTNDVYVYKKIVLAHGYFPKNTKQLKPIEAEILKYYNNVYAALRITFANIMYEMCQKLDADYTTVKDTYILTGKSNDLYLNVNNKLRGFGGMCLPKDVEALTTILKNLNLDFSLIESINDDNKKYETTIFCGMRNT